MLTIRGTSTANIFFFKDEERFQGSKGASGYCILSIPHEISWRKVACELITCMFAWVKRRLRSFIFQSFNLWDLLTLRRRWRTNVAAGGHRKRRLCT